MHTTHSFKPGLLGARVVLMLAVSAASAAAQETPSDTANEPPPAPPQDTGAHCAAAYERAQTDKLAGHYVAASEAALACSQIECNPAIVRECVQLYEALERDTPTLVFAAKAEAGEVLDVRVEMDGKVVKERIDGRPVRVDPGPHQFTFTDPQGRRIKMTQTARVGDRARLLEVTFGNPAAATPTDPLTPGVDGGTQKSGGIPAMSYVLGGIGAVSLGVFAYYRVSAVGDYNHYNASCSPRCSPDDIDPVRTKFLMSYVALSIGAASLAGAGLVYVFGRDGGDARTEASVSSNGSGLSAGLRTRF